MKTRSSARSNVGLRREINQDAYGVEPESGDGDALLLVVCDGMGGHAAGEVASRIGVDKIIEHYRADPDGKPSELLGRAFVEANRQIYTQGRGTMGTTGVAAILHDYRLYVANVGDSRAYLLRAGGIRQISRDHSLVSDQIAAGLMTAEQARASTFRNIITRALGHQLQVDVDHFVEQLRPGDIVLLSSDGMHGLIEDGEIADIFARMPFERAVERLIELSNERGGHDNITVVAAQVDPSDDPPGATANATLSVPTVPLVVPPAASAAPAPAAPPDDRPLRRNGLLLATLLLVVMFASGAYLLFATPAPNPLALTSTAEVAPITTSTPAPTAAATLTSPPAATATTAPTRAPTRSATTRSATTAPTGTTPARSATTAPTGTTPARSATTAPTGLSTRTTATDTRNSNTAPIETPARTTTPAPTTTS